MNVQPGDRVEIFQDAWPRYLGRVGEVMSVGVYTVSVLLDGDDTSTVFETTNVRISTSATTGESE